MRFRRGSRTGSTAVILFSTVAVLVTAGCERSSTTAQSEIGTGAADAPKEIVRRFPDPAVEAPVLLLEEDEPNDAVTGPVADNSRCFVCHINYMAEPIAANHARQNVGCADCHGASDAHIADESWGSGGNGTAPDIMYPRDKVNSACMTCHPRDKINTPQHETVFAESDAKVCTDCHGDHRLAQRRCKWR